MTLQLPDTTTDTDAVPPPPRTPESPAELLQMRLHYSQPGTAVLYLAGAIDLTNTARLSELVQLRLRSQLHQLTLELSQLEFLSINGARALEQLVTFARLQRTTLRITNPTRAVRRALRAIGVSEHLTPLFDEPATREHEHAATDATEAVRHRASELASTLARQGRTSNR